MGCNWGKLLTQNRCKAIGVPWNEQELKAIYELHIPADFVRNGCLTVAEYKKATAELSQLETDGKEKPLIHMKKEELAKKAGELGIQFTPEVTRADLMHLITIEKSKTDASVSILPGSDEGTQES